ncbi:MAG: hypothetical protein ABIT37_07365 [Luteolibacter sp.]
MPSQVRQFSLYALALAALVSGCKPPPSAKTGAPKPAAPVADTNLAPQLAAARVDAAKTKSPDEALALLVSALTVDPQSEEARAAIDKILSETTWNWPTLTLDHHLPIDQVAFASPSSLWVSLSGDANTTVLWDLESLKVTNVLFPTDKDPTRDLIFDPSHQSVVVRRGSVNLLCNARTLKPVRDLGPVPDFLTPSAVIAFSPEGLLVTHPSFVSEQDHSIVWHIKDAASGEIIRSSDPLPESAPHPLAAYLDRRELRVLNADGSLMEMPLSPVEPIVHTPPKSPANLLNAQFAADGNAALTLQEQGPHLPPVQAKLVFGGSEDTSLTPQSLAEHFPWSQHPNIWNGLMNNTAQAGFRINGQQLDILSSPHSPLRAATDITAAAFSKDRVIIGEKNGTLAIHRLLPLPVKSSVSGKPATIDAASLTAIQQLAEAVAGTRYDVKERSFTRLGADERLKALNACAMDSIHGIFPDLEFRPLVDAIQATETRHATPEALLPLWNRLALADAGGKSWPSILSLSKDLEKTPWYQELTAAVISRTAEKPTDSEWNAPVRMEKVFDSAETADILAAINAAGGKGPGAAAALSLALASVHPEWIEACLSKATDLPPVLRKIAKSRIAWLENRKADALSVWPELFPTLAEIRLREDWEGWEQADFSPALEKLRQCANDELTAVEVPEDSTPEQRKAVAARLSDPATLATIGRNRFANACLKAALAMSAFKEDKEATFELAARARELGAAPEPCLRAEALALTALGDYKEAHPRWIELITEHPVETHLPGDYAEAAYTAFENADPRQAMEILTTGIHRYPQDANFALRAGWVALLTGNPERAYQFLQAGQRIGFPHEKLENATALLAIAAAQNGANDDATVYFKDLLKISSDWENPETIETLDWPEELKATLRQLAW